MQKNSRTELYDKPWCSMHVRRTLQAAARIPRSSEEQQAAYHAVMPAVTAPVENERRNGFYIDGPGGSGKTFLYEALIHTVRCRGLLSLACAMSGIPAQLLRLVEIPRLRISLCLHLGNPCTYFDAFFGHSFDLLLGKRHRTLCRAELHKQVGTGNRRRRLCKAVDPGLQPADGPLVDFFPREIRRLDRSRRRRQPRL